MSVRGTDRELSIEEFGKRQFLRPMQRRELEASIRDTEERLQRPDILEMSGGDPATLQKQLAREKRMLEEGTPPDFDAATLRKIAKQKLPKCDGILTNGMPTHTMMQRGRPSDVMHFDAHMNQRHADAEDGVYTTKRADLARKNYVIALESKSPESLDVNYLSHGILRTDTVRGNPALFRKNYDFTAWRESVEADLAGQLDDEEYLFFCGLKALEWADVNIRRKLDWSMQTFDLAMARWREEQNGKGGHESVEDDEELEPKADGEPIEEPVVSEAPRTVKRKPGDPEPLPRSQTGRYGQPRIQVEPGWPKEQLERLGVSQRQFLVRVMGKPGISQAEYGWVRTGDWPIERHKQAQAVLRRLQGVANLEKGRGRKRGGGEPDSESEPVQPETSEPVGTEA
jgi:hypothetical protein